jgi:hypothetical protein
MTTGHNELPLRERVIYVLKVVLCLVSFGFIYPNILRDD